MFINGAGGGFRKPVFIKPEMFFVLIFVLIAFFGSALSDNMIISSLIRFDKNKSSVKTDR